MYTIQPRFRQPPTKTKQILTNALHFLTALSATTPYPACGNTFPSWRVMIYRNISLGRSCAIIFVASTIFCLHPHSMAAQDLESKPASTDHAHLAPCSAVHGDELQPAREDLTGNSLPGANNGRTGARASSGPRAPLRSATEPTAGAASNPNQKPITRGRQVSDLHPQSLWPARRDSACTWDKLPNG
jgi:hypothetical protein